MTIGINSLSLWMNLGRNEGIPMLLRNGCNIILTYASLGLFLHNPAKALAADDPPAASALRSPAIDQYGDPLPTGAIARMGTLRLRDECTWCLVFSPNGESLASAGASVKVWEVTTGKKTHDFLHQSSSHVVFSPNGRMLASGGWNGEVYLWDLQTKKKFRQLLGHQNRVNSLAFSSRGDILASASDDHTARVWDVKTGNELWRSSGHQNDVHAVAFGPDGRSVATGGDDGTIRFWDLASGKEMRRFQKFSGHCQSLIFSADGKTLVSGGAGDIPTGPGSVNVWDLASGEKLSKHEGKWRAAFISPDGKLFARNTSGYDGGIEFLATATGQVISKLPVFLSAIGEMAFSSDGKLLATHDGAIQIWDLATGKPIHRLGGHQREIRAVVFGGAGKFLATASVEGAILWESRTGKQIHHLDQHLKRDPVLSASPDGKLLAVGSHEIFLWQQDSGRVLHRLPEDLLSRPCLAFSKDSCSVISQGQEANFRVWDVASGKHLTRFGSKEPLQHVLLQKLAFSPDGKLGAAAGIDSTNSEIVWTQWNAPSGAEQIVFRGTEAARCDFMTLSPDAHCLACVGRDHMVHIYRVATGTEQLCFAVPHPNKQLLPVLCVEFSPDGRMLATGHSDLSMRLWEVATGKERCKFEGHHDTIRGLTFAPDGRTLASASSDTTALVWDLPSLAGRPTFPQDFQRLWDDLADPDAVKAYRAIWALALAPERTVPLLRTRLRRSVPANPERSARLIQQLNAETYDEREKAMRRLEELGEEAGPALRKSLVGTLSLEARKRVQRLVATLEKSSPSGEALQQVRALEVLELIATSGAQAVLKKLATGPPEFRLTSEAARALRRLQSMN